MQIPRICANCKHLVDPSLRYCPYCFAAVDPVLVAHLQWMHRTLLDLDQRIARGETGDTIQQLHDTIAAEYAALVTDPAPAPVPPAATVASDATGLLRPAVATPGTEPRTFSRSAFFTEQSIAIIAYIGAFLLLVAMLTFEVGGWQALNGTARLMIVVVVYLLFGIAGLALLPHAQHRTISQTYLSIFALMTPLLGLAIYQDVLRYTTFPVVGVVSAVAWYTTVVYLALALRTHITVYGYMSAIALIIAAQYVLPWAGISEDWALCTLALSAIVLLIPEIVGAAHQLSRPALVISLIASVILVLVLFLEGQSLVDYALTPRPIFDPSVQSGGVNQSAFTITLIIAVFVSSAWAFTARRPGRVPWIPVRKWADIITYWLVAFAVVAVAAQMGISQAAASYLLALLALVAGGVALLYLNVASERRLERRYIWTLALFLSTWGYLINGYRNDPNVPIIVALLASTAITCGIAMFESGSAYWWLVYGGVSLTLVLHSLVAGSLGGVPLTLPLQNDTLANMTLIWFHVAIAVAFWAVAMALSWVTARQSSAARSGAAMKHISRPIFTIAVIDSVYATLSLFILFPDTPYRQLAQMFVMSGFAALALIAGRRERAVVSSGIIVGCYGVLALLPYLVANGGYWQWGIPPLVAAGIAILVRAWLGRSAAIPMYVIAIVGMLLGQSRLSVDMAANQTQFLAISVYVWYMVLFGILSVAVAVLERQSQLTLVTAYCAGAAILGTTNQVALYALTLLTLAGAVILQARYGRWWNVWLLLVGVIATYTDISNFGDADPGVFAWKMAFLAVTAIFGYGLLIGMRDESETIIGAMLVVWAPMFSQSFIGDSQWLYTVLLAAEAIGIIGIGVGKRSSIQLYSGSALVGLAALRGAVLAYHSGVPIAVIIAGMALILLIAATWLSLRARANPAVQ